MQRRPSLPARFVVALVASCVLAACSAAATTSDAPADPPIGAAPGISTTTGAPTTSRPPTAAAATYDPTIVMTDKGPVQGELGDIRVFKSIPFAAAPVGDLRWRNPKPPAPWTDVRDVTAPAPLCLQTGTNTATPTGSEDCLYLSVYAPKAPVAGAPTMVWFHGGGYTIGAPAFTDPSALAERYGAVVISPAYRLGPLGFAASSELATEDEHQSSGSYGLADQQRALEWVQDNIGAFGGDPHNVTILGESAGGWSVCAHLVSPASRGLFHKAIVESGPCAMPLVSRERSRRQSLELAKAVGCEQQGKIDLACFRARPAEQLLTALPIDGVFGFNAGTRWGPTIDGWAVRQPIADAVKAGKAADVPLLIGWNTDEGKLFEVPTYVPSGEPFDATAYPEVLLAFAGRNLATAKRIEQQYPLAKYPTPRDAFTRVLGDAALKCPGRSIAIELAKQGRPVYVYSFAYPRANLQIPIAEPDLGAFHSAEIQFVFDTPLNPGNPAEEQLASEMSARWVQFAKTGNPNGGLLSPVWPYYDGSPDAHHLVFDEKLTTGTALDREVCDFWDSLNYDWVKN